MRFPNATIGPGWRMLLAILYDIAPDQFYVERGTNGFVLGQGRTVWHNAN